MLLLGQVVHSWDRDVDGAEGLYKRAVECDPQDANALSLVALARLTRPLPADTVWILLLVLVLLLLLR